MSGGRSLADSFNNKSLSGFLKDYTTTKSRQRAIDTLGQSERATAAALSAFKKVADKNKPVQGMDLTREGMTKGGREKQARVYRAHEKLQVRLDKIDRAKDNRLERIRKSQELEQHVQKRLGRSLSEEFNRGR